MTFEKWVNNYGQANLARKLNLTPQTIWHWIHRGTTPDYPTMKIIIEESEGHLTYELILKETYQTFKTNLKNSKATVH